MVGSAFRTNEAHHRRRVHVRVSVIRTHPADGVRVGRARLRSAPPVTAHVARLALAASRVHVKPAVALAGSIVRDVAGRANARVGAAGRAFPAWKVMTLIGAESDSVVAERTFRVVDGGSAT